MNSAYDDQFFVYFFELVSEKINSKEIVCGADAKIPEMEAPRKDCKRQKRKKPRIFLPSTFADTSESTHIKTNETKVA